MYLKVKLPWFSNAKLAWYMKLETIYKSKENVEKTCHGKLQFLFIFISKIKNVKNYSNNIYHDAHMVIFQNCLGKSLRS